MPEEAAILRETALNRLVIPVWARATGTKRPLCKHGYPQHSGQCFEPATSEGDKRAWCNINRLMPTRYDPGVENLKHSSETQPRGQ